MYKIIATAGVLTLVLQSTSGAQSYTEDVPVELGTILVTAGRTPVDKDKSGRAYTVITAKELEEQNVRYVADALRTVPGFSVSRTGSYGGQTQVRVRGAESNHLLVMIDGVDVGETSTGEYDFSGLIVDDIERIEVLRGPQSAFWGSNATAGVVNIITKGGIRDGFEGTARTEAGSDGSSLASLLMRGGGERYDLALSAALRNTGGYNVSDYGSEDDGDRNATLNGKLNVDLTDWLKLDGTLRYVNRRGETDGQDFTFGSPTYGEVLDTDDVTAMEEFSGSLGLTHTSLNGAWTQKARFSGSDATRENEEDGVVTSSTRGSRINARYQSTYAFDALSLLDGHHSLTGGYEWERETFRPSHLDHGFSRDAHSLVAEYRGEFLDRFYVNGAVRHDFNDRFKDATTFSVAGAWKFVETGTRLHASLGSGITNPTFYEQYGYTPSTFVGNADLKPEESLGWDAGVEQAFFDRRFVVDVTYFNQNLTNEITTVYELVGGSYVSTPVNREGESLRQGVEVTATARLLDRLTLKATYTYTDATEQTEAGGARLVEVRRPRHMGSLNLAYAFLDNRARVFGEAIFNGTTVDNNYTTSPSSRADLAGYTLVNAGAKYRINDRFEVYGRIDNMFDADYEEVYGYNTQGRVAYVGVKGRF
ncbi:vitamin B12 transporter [Breoghania corrubedonensis]|uniref:Vitamin B12 transporter n=1 Tax=Breoghania corrubedonensis TaxID=665038 RepID=A0A2T5VA62_9HYPH|nr:TonB-dependent receptor [Breoghania corrubedonensis]PTW60624.1 vitamin B12 transporter [Breoghania corrubedonensis]